MALQFVSKGLLALSLLQHGVSAQGNTTGANITSDSYFFGQSPPVYPSPKITGTGDWHDAFEKAHSLMSKMTQEEKLNMTVGTSANNACSGNIAPVSRLGFPGLCVSDAGDGLRSAEFVNSWPSGIHVASTWNRELGYSRAHAMSGEFKAKGVNVMLGPVISPMGRMLLDGRTWEGLSSDPYLAGELVYQTITGAKDNGVTTCTKHYIGYEQETNRNPEGVVQSISENIDDKTMHELYLWPFQNAVLAGSGSFMCSYNRLNNSYACQNSKTLNGLLKEELGFQGYVMTDWGALHGGYATALAGLDMAMPNGGSYWGLEGSNLSQSISNGSMPESRLDDMVTRILAAWYLVGQDKGYPPPGIGMPVDLSAPHTAIDGRKLSSRQLLYQGALEGHVLVKNTDNALPLQKPKMLSVFGYSAKSPDWNNLDNWSGGGEPYTGGGSPPDILAYAFNGTMYSGGGSGATSQSLVSSPMNELNNRCWQDNTEMFWDFTKNDPVIAASSDACLVFINAWASEGYDRVSLMDEYSDTLVQNVAMQCSNTIVVIHNAGPRLVDAWVDMENVTAVVYAHMPGQASGKALISLLYGEENFSGRLPYTVAHNASDYGDMASPALPEGIYQDFPQDNFTEGVLVDYRRFDYYNIEPRFEFGYGLSYSSFEYSNLHVQGPSGHLSTYPTGPIESGGHVDLWDDLVTVTAKVTNTGRATAAETAQLYLSIPGSGTNDVPVKMLRGFDKQTLAAGQSAQYTFKLARRDLSEWDVAAQKWKLQTGSYKVMVGSSSRKMPLTGFFTV